MKVITAHSFRGGTGKTNIIANLSYLFAIAGKRVGVVDADATHPSLHIIFGLGHQQLTPTFGEFLLKQCSKEDIIHDISEKYGLKKSLYLIPSKLDDSIINSILRINQDSGHIEMVYDALVSIGKDYSLDYIFIDTKPELDERVLLYLLKSRIALIVTRHDEADISGTKEMLKRLCYIPGTKINIVPSMIPEDDFEDKIAQFNNEFRDFLNCATISRPIMYSQLLYSVHAPKIDKLFIAKYPQDIFSKSIVALAREIKK